GERVAAGTTGEATLRADGQPLEAEILRRFLNSTLQAIHTFQHRRLAADEPEHDALPLRDEAQRREVARSRGVIFEQKMVRVGACEKALRNPFVSTLGKVVTSEIAAAHVDADDHILRTGCDRAINGVNIAV